MHAFVTMEAAFPGDNKQNTSNSWVSWMIDWLNLHLSPTLAPACSLPTYIWAEKD